MQIIAKLAEQTTFVVLPRRWCVERTFSWINRCRRAVRDYERRPDHHAAMVQRAMIILMARRLARQPGCTSWTAVLDAVRLGPADDATAVTAEHLRAVVQRLITAGQWRPGDADILIVCDTGYDVIRLAFVLADLPVQLLGRLRADRVLRLPAPPRRPGTLGRPPKHRGEFALANPATWPTPATTMTTQTSRYGAATAASWDRLHPRLTHRTCGWITPATYPSSKAR